MIRILQLLLFIMFFKSFAALVLVLKVNRFVNFSLKSITNIFLQNFNVSLVAQTLRDDLLED